jgi:hypothetical protein
MLAKSSAPSRGITSADVERAADALLRQGTRPTIERVRAGIGRGSPNTINPLLDEWWRRLAGRLDAGPAALHRVPEPVAHAAEAMWLQALAEARRRVAIETGSARQDMERERQELAVQTQVLSLREQEIQGRLDASERRAARLELEITALVSMLRKEQAARRAAERRLADLSAPAQMAKEKPRSTALATRRKLTGRRGAPKTKRAQTVTHVAIRRRLKSR